MTIRTRVTLAFSATAVVVFAAQGLYQVRTEEKDLRAAIDREMLMLGRSVQVAVENALRDRQLPDIRETLARLESTDPAVDILVFDEQRRVTARSEGSQATGPLQDRVVDEVVARRAPVLRGDPAPPGRLVLGLPLAGDSGALLGCVLVIRPLDDMHRDLTATTRQIVLVAAVLALVTAALGLVLSTIYVGRPLVTVIDGMQRLRRGELRGELKVGRGDDEIARVSREFNFMVSDLAAARRRLVEEGEARVRMERGLQRVDKMAAIGQLAAGLAHEIGSPLQVLGGRARALLERPHDAAETARIAAILVEQTDRIRRIVDQLLHFARRRPPAVVSFDLVVAVRAIHELLAPEARRRGVELGLTADPPSIPIEADPDQLQQAVLNLVMNSLAATPPGGSISVDVRAAGGSTPAVARLTVADTGAGIGEDVKPLLFEPFFTTRAAEGGTGLGLAVVRTIVEEHGGTIAFDSEAGRGSSFSLEIPLRRGTRETAS